MRIKWNHVYTADEVLIEGLFFPCPLSQCFRLGLSKGHLEETNCCPKAYWRDEKEDN